MRADIGGVTDVLGRVQPDTETQCVWSRRALGAGVMESLPVFLRSGCLVLEGLLPQNRVRCLRQSGLGPSVEVFQRASLCFGLSKRVPKWALQVQVGNACAPMA